MSSFKPLVREFKQIFRILKKLNSKGFYINGIYLNYLKMTPQREGEEENFKFKLVDYFDYSNLSVNPTENEKLDANQKFMN